MGTRKFQVICIAISAVLSISNFCFAKYSGGSGEPNTPYRIASISDWNDLMTTSADWNKYFVMTADVNLYGISLTPIGNSTTKFTGTLNGDGHIISNAVIHRSGSDYVGLFGYIAGGKIKKLCLKNVDIIGNSYVGGLAGRMINSTSASAIEYCYVTGGIAGNSYVGGLIGNNNGGRISNCYSAGGVAAYSSTAYAGGLVGYSEYYGDISNCYSTSDVNAASTSNYAGGLVGYNSSRISYCYSTGSVVAPVSHAGGLVGRNMMGNDIPNCFWDTQTSGLSVGVASGTSTGAIGKMTADMKILSTFANTGWNISDVNDGTADWFMYQDGQAYPKISFFVYCDYSIPIPFAGDGTPDNPYQISSPQDFAALSQIRDAWRSHIILTTDIDLSGFTVYPIGNSIVKFTGSFNGQGFVIRNATINLPNKNIVGLFGTVDSNGLITNLGVEDVNIVGKQFVGGLAGYNCRSAITNCYSTGYVAGNPCSNVGGLIGVSFGGAVSNCYSTASVSGAGATIGGLVGVNACGSTISNCYAAGAITNNDANGLGSYTGGLVGYIYDSNIYDCYAAGNVSAWSPVGISIGGLVGDSGPRAVISNCYAAGNVYASSASSSVAICEGGLVGAKSNCDVNDCYSIGTVICDSNSSPDNYVGGMIGLNFQGGIKHCYSKGAVIANEGGLYVGGFTGLNFAGTSYGCFWDIQTSGRTASGGGRGLATEQMKAMQIYQNAGWANSGWVMNDSVDYPRLDWEGTEGVPIPAAATAPLSGSGTAADPYQVWTAADFAYLSWYTSVLDKHISLMADIDLAGIRVCPIGEFGPFTGSFDGNGHIIRNVCIYQPTNSYIGVFGYVGTAGAIIGLGIRDVNVVGMDYVGGLIGRNEGGMVSGCYSIGTTAGESYIGGLIGSNEGGTVSGCSSIGGRVDGIDVVGGLIGGNQSGTVSDCYSTVPVVVWDSNEPSCAGGLVGYNNDADIVTCYSTGRVLGSSSVGGLVGYNTLGSINRSFWDVNTSGMSTSAGGTGKTTVNMKMQSTFAGAGWNFVNVWIIDEGISYPLFAWQNVFVPNVTGMTEAQANAAIADANLAVGTVIKVYSYAVPEGYVMEQMPAADTLMAKGSAVNLVVSLGDKYSGGSGTAADPYRIANPNDLLVLSADANDYTKDFILINDIDMAGYIFNKAVIAPNPTSFNGIFDGRGYKITNFTINGIDYVALFGYVGEAGIIKNLGVEDCDVNGVQYMGGIAGYNQGSIDNCHLAGNVRYGGLYYRGMGNPQCIGGIAGWNKGSISNCISTGWVGSIGLRQGVVFGVGGLAGVNYGYISQCYSSMSTVCGLVDLWFVGGVTGYNRGSISKCYSTGLVSGFDSVGGVVGSNVCYEGSAYLPPIEDSGKIENCYSTGAVSGNLKVGGLCGSNGDIFDYSGGLIRNCYSTGAVSGTRYIGGLCGYSFDGNYVSCYFLDTVGPDNGLGEPLTDSQMKQQASFINWDFPCSDSDDPIWFMAFDGYPILTWQILPADIYTDGENNLKDFAVFAKYWLRENCRMYNDFCEWSDMDFDHDVDIDDLAYFMSYWLEKGIY